LNSPADVKSWLAEQERKELLRFITCGSVDDGKSTLIGRLLYETRQVFDDQLAALEADSKRHGTQGEKIDFALLVDGLSAEREQGITIDVAYRYFSSEKRKFIVPKAGETVETRRVRYRTVGDASQTAAVLSEADTVEKVIDEVAATRITERGATRGDDRFSEAAMEDRKKEGYF